MAQFSTVPELRTHNQDSDGTELALGTVSWGRYLVTHEDGTTSYVDGLTSSDGEYLRQGDRRGGSCAKGRTGRHGWIPQGDGLAEGRAEGELRVNAG